MNFSRNGDSQVFKISVYSDKTLSMKGIISYSRETKLTSSGMFLRMAKEIFSYKDENKSLFLENCGSRIWSRAAP